MIGGQTSLKLSKEDISRSAKDQILLEQTKSTSATGCRDPKLITADVL
jgi:hypothetical protein